MFSHSGVRIELGFDAQVQQQPVSALPHCAHGLKFTPRGAFTMRGISLDAKCSHIWVLESSLDLMPKGTSHLSDTCCALRARSQHTSRYAFTVRGVSLDAKCSHILVQESSLDSMLNGTSYLSKPCRTARAAFNLQPEAHSQCEA